MAGLTTATHPISQPPSSLISRYLEGKWLITEPEPDAPRQYATEGQWDVSYNNIVLGAETTRIPRAKGVQAAGWS